MKLKKLFLSILVIVVSGFVINSYANYQIPETKRYSIVEKEQIKKIIEQKIDKKLMHYKTIDGKKNYLIGLIQRADNALAKIRTLYYSTNNVNKQNKYYNLYAIVKIIKIVAEDKLAYYSKMKQATPITNYENSNSNNNTVNNGYYYIIDEKEKQDIINQLKSNSYNEFDKAILKLQQKQIVEFIENLSNSINKSDTVDGKIHVIAPNIEGDIKLNKMLIAIYNNVSEVKGGVNGDFTLGGYEKTIFDTDFDLITDQNNNEVFLKLNKFMLSGADNKFSSIDTIKEYMGKYVKFTANNAKKYDVEQIKKVFKTEPLFKAVKLKNGKYLILPGKGMVDLKNALGENTSVEDLLNKTKFTKEDFFTYKVNGNDINIFNIAKTVDVRITKYGDIKKLKVDEKDNFMDISIDYNKNISGKINLDNGNITGTVSGNLKTKYKMDLSVTRTKYDYYSSSTKSIKDNYSLIVDAVKNSYDFEYKSDSDLHTINFKANLIYNKDTGWVKIDANMDSESSRFGHKKKSQLSIKGEGTLKEGKSDFNLELIGIYPQVGKFKLKFDVKDTPVGYNKYDEKINLTIYSLNLKIFDLKGEFMVTKNTVKPIIIPTKYIDYQKDIIGPIHTLTSINTTGKELQQLGFCKNDDAYIAYNPITGTYGLANCVVGDKKPYELKGLYKAECNENDYFKNVSVCYKTY